jgi:hypothetical protein
MRAPLPRHTSRPALNPPRPRRRTVRPQLECLEDRTLLTVLATQLMMDHFDNNDVNAFSSNWSVVQGATHDVFLRQNPPSNAYAIRLDVDSSGGNLLTSSAFDLSSETHATLSYYYERTGGGAATRAGDDLIVEGLSPAGDWVQLDSQPGSGPAMSHFQQRTIALPANFLYNGFEFRFRRAGTGGDWFIDDVGLSATTGYANYWSDQSQQTGVYYPNTLTFTFPNTPPPTGGGSLTITAVGDLGSNPNKYLALSAGGQSLGNVFGTDGRSFSTIQTTVPLSQSLLQTLTATGSFQLTVTPGPGVFGDSHYSTPITVHLEYATGTGNSGPTVDLNGPNVAGNDYAATFTPGGGPVSIVDAVNMTVTDSAGQPDPASLGLYLVGTNGNFTIDRIDPNNPQTTQILTAGGNLLQPRDVAVDANGDLLVSEFSQPFHSTVSLVRVNPFSGSQEVFSSGASAVLNVAANRATGEIFIEDVSQGILRVDPITGAQTPLTGGGFVASSMSIDTNGDILGGSNRQVDRVNHITGTYSLVSANGYLIGNVEGTAVEPTGTILAISGSGGAGNVVRIDPVTGAQTLLTSGGLLNTPRDLAVGDDGSIYVLDSSKALIQVDPVTGQQTLLANDFTFQQDFGLAALLPGPAGMNSIIQSGRVTISNLRDGSAESLAASTAGTRITASYNPATGVLSLTGPDTVANYQQVLSTVTYQDSAANPDTTPRRVLFVVNDGTLDSPVAVSTVSFGPSSTSPTLAGFFPAVPGGDRPATAVDLPRQDLVVRGPSEGDVLDVNDAAWVLLGSINPRAAWVQTQDQLVDQASEDLRAVWEAASRALQADAAGWTRPAAQTVSEPSV